MYDAIFQGVLQSASSVRTHIEPNDDMAYVGMPLACLSIVVYPINLALQQGNFLDTLRVLGCFYGIKKIRGTCVLSQTVRPDSPK
jgi:hypothetical protein